MSRRTQRKMVRCGAVHSKKLAGISSDAERLYWRIYMASDNFGTMLGDAFDVKSEAAPMVQSLTEAKVGKALNELVAVGLLQRWSDGEQVWINVVGHDGIQSPDFIRKRGARKTPAPPETSDCEPKAGVLCPSGEFSAPLTSTSTSNKKTNTSVLKPDPDQEAILEVLEHWQAVFGKQNHSIDKRKAADRWSRVRSRLSEGWTVNELKTALEGQWSRPWIKDNPQFHDIPTVLKNSAKVEEGITLSQPTIVGRSVYRAELEANNE